MNLLELMPELALYGFVAIVAGVVLVIVWLVWGSYLSVPAPGQIIGYFMVFGRYGKVHREIEGRLVDASHLFLGPVVASRFKTFVLKEIEQLLQSRSLGVDREKLEETKEELENCTASQLSSVCRVIVAREKRTKHAFIQVGNLKPIGEYVSTSEKHRFSFGLGPESEGVLIGDMFTLSRKVRAPFGSCQTHIFMPQEPSASSERGLDKYEVLANVLKIPFIIESQERVESLENELAQEARARMDLAKDLDASKANNFVLERMVRNRGVDLDTLIPKQLDVVDFLFLALPTVLGNHLAGYVNVEPYIGLFTGLAAGFFLVYRRMKR